MKQKLEAEEKQKRKEMKLEPKEKKPENHPLNNLFGFSSNDKDKIRASEILKIVNEKLKIKKKSD